MTFYIIINGMLLSAREANTHYHTHAITHTLSHTRYHTHTHTHYARFISGLFYLSVNAKHFLLVVQKVA